MNDDFVMEALKALRRADEDVAPGPESEVRALLAFRRSRRRRASRRIAWLIGSAAAAILLAVVFRPAPPTPAPAAVNRPAAVAPIDVAAVPPAQDSALPLKTVARQAPREITTDFFPLMASQPPLERALLVRVTVPAATMRAFGLAVGDQYLTQPVQADVLIGQDDLARAIRFVSYRK